MNGKMNANSVAATVSALDAKPQNLKSARLHAAAHQAGSLFNALDEISSRLPFDRFERLKPTGPQPIRAVLRISLCIVVLLLLVRA
jgi:hypothetical protein